MQNIAREMNLPETAFLVRRGDEFDLRWFTPTVEVDLCGHATLASAHILWEKGILRPEQQGRFNTRSGLLTAARPGEWIELDFPSTPEEALEGTTPDFETMLNCAVVNVARNRFDYLVEVASAEVVRTLRPLISSLAEIPVRGLIVTSANGAEPYDFVSRFFAPAAGIDEDPVTGSAHCFLGPYWAARLGKLELLAYQRSSRGGEVRVEVRGDRVILGGKAVTIMHGTLTV